MSTEQITTSRTATAHEALVAFLAKRIRHAQHVAAGHELSPAAIAAADRIAAEFADGFETVLETTEVPA